MRSEKSWCVFCTSEVVQVHPDAWDQAVNTDSGPSQVLYTHKYIHLNCTQCVCENKESHAFATELSCCDDNIPTSTPTLTI